MAMKLWLGLSCALLLAACTSSMSHGASVLMESDREFARQSAFAGNYMTVWEKQPDGTWKVLFDTGDPDPPATAR